MCSFSSFVSQILENGGVLLKVFILPLYFHGPLIEIKVLFFNYECEQETPVIAAVPETLPPVKMADNFTSHSSHCIYFTTPVTVTTTFKLS